MANVCCNYITITGNLEILDIIAAYESGLADAIKQEYENIDQVLIKEGGQVGLSPEQKADRAIKRAITKKQEVLNKLKLKETATSHRIDTIENSLSTIYAYARKYMSSARNGLSYEEIKRETTSKNMDEVNKKKKNNTKIN